MDYERLLQLLDIESPEEFEYFDHLADLMELEEEVDYDGFYLKCMFYDSWAIALSFQMKNKSTKLKRYSVTSAGPHS